MDENRRSFRAIVVLIFVCLSLRLESVTGKPFRANRTGGYIPVMQSSRTITVGRNALHDFNERNNNNYNQKPINATKVSAKSDGNIGSDIYSAPMSSDSQDPEWGLQFDPNYFASLNAANHRPIDAMIASPTDSQSKVISNPSSSSSNSGDNRFYYSPETYGKTTHKNHKTNSFAYLYPSSSSTTTTTTTPSPKVSHNRVGDSNPNGNAQDSNSEPRPYSQPYNPNDKQSVNYNYEETPEGEDEEPNYYDVNEEVDRKYYYSQRPRPKHYPIRDYYGSDLSSMPTNTDHSKVKSVVNSAIPSYGAQEEIESGPNIRDPGYQSGGHVMFPSKYGSLHSSGSGAHYPSYYSSQYPLASEHSYSGGESLLHRSSNWLGPGLAGVLLGLGLPLGLLMATMIPAFMSMPIVSTATVGRKKRFISDFDLLSFNNTRLLLNSGILEILSKYGMSSLEDPQCLSEMFCAFASEGRTSKKNLIQNFVYNLIDLTPNRLAKWLSMDTLFNAVKHNKCEPIYKCMSRKVKLKDTDRYNN